MRKRLCIISMICVLLACGISGCGQQSKEAVKVENFTLSEYDSAENTTPVGEADTVTFYIQPTDIDENAIEVVTEDASIVKCLIQDIRLVSGNRLAIVSYYGLQVGETSFYLRDINGGIQSEPIHVIVEEVVEEIDNSRVVYLNYSGDKYHYSVSCAGDSAYESTFNKAQKLRKEPCSKCVN